MSNPANITIGSLVVKNLPDLFCFKDARDLISQMPTILGVEVPNSVSNVVVSNEEPSSSQTTSVWFRISNSGGFIGIYVFSQGKWQLIFPTPNGIFWMYGDSTDIPEGYMLVDASNPAVDPVISAALVATYIDDPTVTFYIYFAVTWIGF